MRSHVRHFASRARQRQTDGCADGHSRSTLRLLAVAVALVGARRQPHRSNHPHSDRQDVEWFGCCLVVGQSCFPPHQGCGAIPTHPPICSHNKLRCLSTARTACTTNEPPPQAFGFVVWSVQRCRSIRVPVLRLFGHSSYPFKVGLPLATHRCREMTCLLRYIGPARSPIAPGGSIHS